MLAYLLAACGGGTAGTTAPTAGPLVRDTPVAAPTQPIPPTAAAAPSADILPTVTAQPGAARPLISYHKSGGIAGVDETLTVYTNGTVEIHNKSSSTKVQADPGDLQALEKLLSSPEFAALQLPVQPPAADQFVYELTVPGRPKPLVIADSADNPPVVRQLIDTLEKLKSQAK